MTEDGQQVEGTLSAEPWTGAEGTVRATLVTTDERGASLVDVHERYCVVDNQRQAYLFVPGEPRWVFPSRGFRFEPDEERADRG